ncbi:hypothetical protein BIW11_02386 [Tropilaelaps mercedesae]|uniref:Alpha-latrotoxin n=1 Tax=Tropilaelaps mercedesae TaxID=418985 RepID=A0A1V9WYF9_9ACAR|nr:hypothetical protein BIW11_02386 [Tropilaelaps mercedesae]
MEKLRRLNFVELHRELLACVANEEDALPASLRGRINELRWPTREFLVNTSASVDGSVRTPLLIACGSAKRRTIDVLLAWHAVPTVEEFHCVLRSNSPQRAALVEQLLRRARPSTIQRVFWLSCQYNEADLAAACLNLGACLDSLLRLRNPLEDAPAVWRHTGPPDPLLFAASQGYAKLVKVLEKHGADMTASDDDDIGCLMLAAFGRHAHVVEYLLSKLAPSVDDTARVYEVLGAAHVIAGNTGAGKAAWKKAINVLEKAGGHKCRYVAQIDSLDATLGFRTKAELEHMRAKDFRIQALIIVERHLGRTRLFTEALLATPYTIQISIFTLRVILHHDKLTVDNLLTVQTQLEKLGFFKTAEVCRVMDCLEWCIAAVGHLRDLVEIHPISQYDLVRYKALVKFASRVLLCLELHSENDVCHSHLQHLLRRIVGVCCPMAHVYSLLHHLVRARTEQHGSSKSSIFVLLLSAGADLAVLDADCNTLLHEAVMAQQLEDQPVDKDLINCLIKAGVSPSDVNSQGISVEDTVRRLLDDATWQYENSDISVSDED